jgi:hypothetical protein
MHSLQLEDSMKTYPRIFFLSLMAILCCGLFDQNPSWSSEPAGGRENNKIIFQWAFCSLLKADTGQRLDVITRDTTLKTGDQIKFFVKLESPCYLYLIYQSSQRELSVLYPARFKHQGDQDTRPAKQYIPEGNQWFELDEHSGTEKFFLLASSARLLDLETLINQYERADKAKKSGLADNITSEIQSLRKRHLKFKTYAEKPATIIGNLRGAEQSASVHSKDIADYAVEISTTTFFSRTYTIDHQQE